MTQKRRSRPMPHRLESGQIRASPKVHTATGCARRSDATRNAQRPVIDGSGTSIERAGLGQCPTAGYGQPSTSPQGAD
ncbi:hypothetical protein CAOG_009709 [Capsaspora owczarzaki ATCC 30864]|uniref:Uncharacterized protein n=1 Tax=Capsaspora owczarzaki (strain ATCC 30864) TaxID=595528 RepID=A0A0D2VQF6_CAPO3|nr:hypothetical protein CAOG_009709 [Capsaspora owczarzaki ATCC 30864]